MKTYLGFDYMTVEEIEGYLGSEWDDFLPTYQEGCIKWLIKEIRCLRNQINAADGQDTFPETYMSNGRR